VSGIISVTYQISERMDDTNDVIVTVPYIRKVLASNIGPEIVYREQVFHDLLEADTE
jgi:hypothetical protein